MSDCRWLIVTDLDGTLLDHDSYSFAPAKATLATLESLAIPVIINSSKTEAEIATLREQLDNQHPFIIENGSAVLLPNEYFSHGVFASGDTNEQVVILGQKREQLLSVLDALTEAFPGEFVSYSQSTIADIVAMTGLDSDCAKQSARRYYTEPLKWLGDQQRKSLFIETAKSYGLFPLEGGRFIHLMGDIDKGRAMSYLAKQYAEHYQQPVKTIALGDSQNDVAMLQAADIAVVIRSKHHSPLAFDHANRFVSERYGPEGWAEVIDGFLSEKILQ